MKKLLQISILLFPAIYLGIRSASYSESLKHKDSLKDVRLLIISDNWLHPKNRISQKSNVSEIKELEELIVKNLTPFSDDLYVEVIRQVPLTSEIFKKSLPTWLESNPTHIIFSFALDDEKRRIPLKTTLNNTKSVIESLRRSSTQAALINAYPPLFRRLRFQQVKRLFKFNKHLILTPDIEEIWRNKKLLLKTNTPNLSGHKVFFQTIRNQIVNWIKNESNEKLNDKMISGSPKNN